MSRLLEDDHDGLTPERKNELQLALKTPLSMPNTQSEIAADRERRAKAMLEINVGDLSLLELLDQLYLVIYFTRVPDIEILV